MAVARNRAVNVLRCRRRLPVEWDDDALAVAADGPDPAAASDLLSTQARVQGVLAELSVRGPNLSFRVFSLCTIDARSPAEVADMLGMTPGQVRIRAYRMRRKFRALYNERVDSGGREADEGRPRDGERKNRA